MLNHSKRSAFVPVSTSTLMLRKGVVSPPPQPMTLDLFGGVLTPSLGQSSFLHRAIPSNGQFIKKFSNPADVNFAPKNINASSHNPENKVYNTGSAKLILNFAQKIAVIPTQFANTVVASSSHPPTPPPLVSNGGVGSMLKLRMQDNLARHIKKSNQQANGISMLRRLTKWTNTRNVGRDPEGIINGQWTPDEDRILKELVTQYGEKKWSKIAMLLKGRIAKQCRERWYNHVQPNIKKGPWTLEEDILLINAHKEFGNKWAKIAKKIPGRSENTIKNRWNGTKRSKNIKGYTKNNNGDEYYDALLRAYIKDVALATATKKKQQHQHQTEEKEMEKKKKKKNKVLPNMSIGKDKAPMFSDLCNTSDGLDLSLRIGFPNP